MKEKTNRVARGLENQGVFHGALEWLEQARVKYPEEKILLTLNEFANRSEKIDTPPAWCWFYLKNEPDPKKKAVDPRTVCRDCGAMGVPLRDGLCLKCQDSYSPLPV
jgi:hypothetical protein